MLQIELEEWPPGIEANLGNLAWPQEVGRGETCTGGFQTQTCKALEDYAGQAVPVADEKREDTDEQGFLDEAGQNVLVCPRRPEQAGQRDVDRGQCGGKVSDLASEQPEPGIDVTGECLQELINNASAAHNSLLLILLN